MRYLNVEKYVDITAGKAIENVAREQRKNRREKYRKSKARDKPKDVTQIFLLQDKIYYIKIRLFTMVDVKEQDFESGLNYVK